MAFYKTLGYLALPTLMIGMGSLAATGCDGEDGPLGDLASSCGLTCAAEGTAEGNFSISGIPNVDGFFAAVVRLNEASAQVTGNIQGELDAIAVSLGLEKGAGGADIKAALEAKIAANLEGGLSIEFAPPKCEVSASATIEATASCDVEVDAGEVSASCEGSCEAEVSASGEVECGAEAEVVCEGTAPNFACEGTCTGSCELEAGASCEGTCQGECEGTCTVTNADGSCNGSCEGECKGSCELTAGASCEGKCTGSCSYTPPDAKCEASASASCKADVEAEASVECTGSCDGKVTPPSASAECEASAQAEAEVSAECTPPSLEVNYELSAEVAADADATLEFNAWLSGFKGHLSALVAASAKADILADAALDLAASGKGAVVGVFDGLATSGDLKTSIGAGCAVAELGPAVELVVDAGAEVAAQVEATAQIVAVVKP
jgi:hypothetical protein